MIRASTRKRCFRVFDDFTKSIFSFLPRQKCDLVEVEKSMFKETNYPLYLIFYFLRKRNLHLREVEKHVSSVRLALLFIFYLLGNPIYDLCDFGRAMIRVNPRLCKVFFCLLGPINETYLT
jgi:hypothetical protein